MIKAAAASFEAKSSLWLQMISTEKILVIFQSQKQTDLIVAFVSKKFFLQTINYIISCS
jgi:hypothetical protein